MKSNFEEDCFWDDQNGCFMRPSFFPNKWVPFRPSVWEIKNPNLRTTEFRPHSQQMEEERLTVLKKSPYEFISDNKKTMRDFLTMASGKSEPISPLKNLGDRGGEMPDISGSKFKDSEPWNIRNPESIQSRFGSQWQSDWAGSVPSLKNSEGRGGEMPERPGWSLGYPEDPQSEKPNSNFNGLIGKILEEEGGFVNDPDDPGCATNRGICWNTWTQTAGSILGKDPTLENLKDLTEGEAARIYKQEYWDKMNLDSIENKSLQHIIFDGGVNHGIGTSARMVQKSINALGGQVKVDGSLGPKTAEAVNKLDPEPLFNQIKERRYAHYDKIIEKRPSQAKFRKGWRNRVGRIEYEPEGSEE